MILTRCWAVALLTSLPLLALGAPRAADSSTEGWVHAIARYGLPKYPADFAHYDYVNPDAPKGGTLTLPNPDRTTNFDKLNPFSVKGSYQRLLISLVFETLCVLGGDEPYTGYGLLAQSMKPAPDDSAITFRIDPRARFSNGDPVTAEDVRASFELVTDKDASPFWTGQFENVKSATAIDDRTIRFDLIHPDRFALIQLAVSLPVFSAKWGLGPDGKRKPVNQIIDDVPIASGPYRVAETSSGRRMVLALNPDYWARDLPVRKGFFNYGRIVIKYYLDQAAELEAFKAGEFDLIQEFSNRRWNRQHVGDKYDSGQIVKERLPVGMGQYLQAFIFNLRRPLFRDPRVREAFDLAYDFGVSYRQSGGVTVRADSMFTNSPFAASGEANAEELALLAPFAAELDPRALAPLVDPLPNRLPPVHERLARALELLHQAGWISGPDGMLRDASGNPCEFEYLTDDPTSVTEAAWQHNLARIGVRMRIRRSDFALVLERLNNFEFDVFLMNPGNFLLPLPADLESLYGSASADKKGSVNIGGVKDPAVDRLIDAIRKARTETQLRVATRAFDREFRSRHYSVATGLSLFDNFAHWNTIALPAKRPVFYAIEEPGFHPLLWPVMTSWARPPATVSSAAR